MERERDPRVAGEGEEAGDDEENSLLASSRAEAWEGVDQAMQESPEEWQPMDGAESVDDMCRCDQGSCLPPAEQIETTGTEQVVGC